MLFVRFISWYKRAMNANIMQWYTVMKQIFDLWHFFLDSSEIVSQGIKYFLYSCNTPRVSQK